MTLTPDDQALLTRIHDARDPAEFARLLFEYYDERGRADRTSREQMYLHLGMCTGMILKQRDQSSKIP
jgi:hypothetical protein